MTNKEWEGMIVNKEPIITEETLIVSQFEYQSLSIQMGTQGIKDAVHILSMNYTPLTGELKIKRQYFK